MLQMRGLILLCFCALMKVARSQNAYEMKATPLQDMISYIEQFQRNRAKFNMEQKSANHDRSVPYDFQNTLKEQQQSKETPDRELHVNTTQSNITDAPISLIQIKPKAEAVARKRPVPLLMQNNIPYVPMISQSASNNQKSIAKRPRPHAKRVTLRSRPKISLNFSTTGNPAVKFKTTNYSTTVQTESIQNSTTITQISLNSKLLRRRPRPSTKTPKDQIQIRTNSLLNNKTQVETESPQNSIIDKVTTYHPPLISKMFQVRPTSQILIKDLSKQNQPHKININNLQIPKEEISKVHNETVQRTQSEFNENENKRQAETAKYEFSSEIDDGINGNLHHRTEMRDGLSVKGRYSYSDGYYTRTVIYEADDKGYRVLKEEVAPVYGSQGSEDGHAKINSFIAGNTVNYEITKDDIPDQNLIRLKKD